MFSCIPWIRFVPMLVLPLILPLASGCVHHHHPRSVVTIVGPPTAPAHGHRHSHGRIVLVFDRSLGCYAVEGHSDYYFHSQYYYRHHEGVWQRARRLEGPWLARVGSLPPGLEKRYAGSRRAQPPASPAPDAAKESRQDPREGRRKERDAAQEQRAEEREEARDQRATVKHRRLEEREAAQEQRAEDREEARDQRATVKHRRLEEREAAHEPRTEANEPRTEAKEPRTEAREQRAEAREPRMEAREQQLEAKAGRTTVKEQRTEAKQPRVQAEEQRATALGKPEKPAGSNKAAAKKGTDAEPAAKLDDEGEELVSPPKDKEHSR